MCAGIHLSILPVHLPLLLDLVLDRAPLLCNNPGHEHSPSGLVQDSQPLKNKQTNKQVYLRNMKPQIKPVQWPLCHHLTPTENRNNL